MQNGGRFDVLRFILLSNPVIASQSADWRGNPYSLLVALRRGRRPRRPARTAPLSRRRGDPCGRPSHSPNPVIASQCAHWCGNPYPPRISCIFLRRAGCPHPVADKHSTPQTLSLRAHSAVAIRPPFFVASVGVGVPDDPHAQPPCHAVGATLAVARRTPQTLSLRGA